MGPCPRRSARDSSPAPFLAFVLTLRLTGCFLKILVCACFFFFLCQVPWVVARSDWNHIHVFMSAAPTIFYFLFFFFLGRLAASCGAVASACVMCNISETPLRALKEDRCIF